MNSTRIMFNVRFATLFVHFQIRIRSMASKNNNVNKRCTSSTITKNRMQTIEPLKPTRTLSRSKTCAFTSHTMPNPRLERLQPLVFNETLPSTDETIVNVFVVVMERCLSLNLDCLSFYHCDCSQLNETNGVHPAMVTELVLHARNLCTIPNLCQVRTAKR
jgi:hypothetical protein